MLNNTRTLKALATQHLWWCLCILRQELRGFLESCPPCLMQSLDFGVHGCGKGRPWMVTGCKYKAMICNDQTEHELKCK